MFMFHVGDGFLLWTTAVGELVVHHVALGHISVGYGMVHCTDGKSEA